jgi:hypothetical protein
MKSKCSDCEEFHDGPNESVSGIPRPMGMLARKVVTIR